MKNLNRGITLIALVITIIVLLILAGVSIAMLTGDNGILTQAKTAKEKTGKEALKEEINLMFTKRKTDEMTGNKLALKEDLEKEIKGDKVVEEIEGITDVCYLTKDNQTLTIYDDGTIIEEKIEIWDGETKNKPIIDDEGNWHIKTASELKYFADFMNGKLSEEEKEGISVGETTVVYLENYIDLGARQTNGTKTRGTNWNSIGKTKETEFKGIFDGNNYTIRGMYIDETDNFTGFFGRANEIKNLTIKDSYLSAGNCVGAFAGIGYKLENCHNENTAVISKEGNYYTIGGVVGQINEKIVNCSNSGTVTANGFTSNGSQCGGIAGMSNTSNTSIIEKCYNTGVVTGKGGVVGGIVGQLSSLTFLKESRNIGKILGEDRLVGGIAGLSSGDIEKSENAGKIIGKGERVGGITGISNSSTIIKEYKNTGEILGENILVGGIAGINAGNLEKSENTGKVVGKGARVGGIAGNNSTETSIIKECKNSGEILGEENDVGGIAGIGFSNIENCHNIGKITGKALVGGILGAIGDEAKSNIINCSNEGNIEATGIYQNTDIAIGGIIGWTSATGTSGKIENVYNKGKVISKATGRGIGGIIGRNSNTFELINCYNKGIVEGKEGIGSIIGIQIENNNDNVSNSYYLNTLRIKAINNADDPSKNIIGVSDDINDYEQFINWITTK